MSRSTWIIEVRGKRMIVPCHWGPWRPLHGCYTLRRHALNNMDPDTPILQYRARRYVRVVHKKRKRA